MIVNLYLIFVIKIYLLLSIYQADAIDPDRELVYDGTIFAIFSASTDAFSQKNAVDSCISWGGNLASINSQEEDAQLFNLTTDTLFQCWIGLNRHQNSNIIKGPQGYSWEDGSNSLYRKFTSGSLTKRYMKFRPNNGYSSGEGWYNASSDQNTNCYLCRKLANSRSCDFTNDSFCYRTYQNDAGINWDDAQSSCEEWRGNLASVNSEAENLLLFQRTPIIASDCWAGKYTTVNGTTTWNDGNNFSYTRWNPGESPSPTTGCIGWNDQGSSNWFNTNCNTTMLLNCYICKRIQTTVSIPGVQYETLNISVFGYFYASWPGVTWNTALQECIGWGGSLASIESAEDGTLYSLAVGNDTQCWIGLEISTCGNDSDIWVDGSDSSYRNYPGQTPTITSIDKYYSLRSMNGGSGGGWNALNMAETLSCFYCEKLANQRGYDLIYNGSCYRTFETNTALNWNDSQSNCMSWEGDLASITSQQENDFLFHRTPNSAINCWIGLTDVNNNGLFQWIDGEKFIYNNWAGGTPNNDSTADCTQSKIGGNNGWENFPCNILAKCHICKGKISFLWKLNLGEILFGELINNKLGYKELGINSLLFQNITLICGDVINSSSSSTSWIYFQNNNLSMNATLNSDNFNPKPGIKYISVFNSHQGFYQCRIQKQDGITLIYTVGVFDLSVTTVAEEERTYNYTIGIDRTDILLLCAPMNTSIDPINYSWEIIGEDGYMNNPIILSNFSRINTTFICGSTTLIIRASTLTITYQSSFMETQSKIYPNTNQLSIEGLKQDFTLSMNIEGRWKLPDETNQTGSIIIYPYLLQQYTGLYTFYLYNWDGIEVPAIQTNITATDNLGIFISTVSRINKWEILQNESRLFLTEQLVTILCVGPRITSSVEWFREDTLLIGSDGISTLDEGSLQTPGYYNCRVDEVSTYYIYIANKNILVEITDFTETVNYTLGSPTLLYHSNDSVTLDSQILWAIEDIETGDDRIFNPEYPNPVPLSTIFSDVGGGQHTFTCFYRNSPVTVLGSVKFNMKGTTIVTISYNNIEKTFSDISNPSFPTPQRIEIPEGTVNINFNCNLSECRWKVKYNSSRNDIMEVLLTNLRILSREDEGTYSIYRTTVSEISYTTASIYIQVIPSLAVSAGVDTTTIIVIILVVIILTTLTIIIISLMVYLYIWKRQRGKNGSQSKPIYQVVDDDKADSGNQNGTYCTIDEANCKNAGTYTYIVIEPIDEEIDETTFIYPAEGPNYQNLKGKIYEKIPNDPRMVPIHLDTFKAHVDKIWKEDGLLEGEYGSFGGKSLRYPFNAALEEENRTKNRFKLIYPYDKSRVVLKSINENSSTDYINASHIPGLYVKNNFICSQAPKEYTLKSFWQMITENNVVNIVMVTNLVEMGQTKCAAYFPLSDETSVTIGPYDIVLVQEDVVIGYTIRTLKVSFNGRTTEIKHFHFTAWPDHDVPVLHDELLLFVEKVQESLIESNSPILIHCSAGVGRSGTFLSLFNLSSAIKERKSICIYNLVNEMREHRPQMVQTFAQYKFIYLSVLEMLLGNTSIPCKSFTDTYNLYMQSENEGYVSLFFQQYNELNYQCDKTFEHICKVAQNECNESKNPITSTLPRDSNRVVLFSPHWESDYINATNFDGIECVVTINPTQNTLQDFLQLIYQTETSLVVMLTTPKELKLIEEGTSDRVVYWPNQGEPINTDGFILKSLLNEKSSSFLHNEINLVHKIEQVDKSFEQFISSKWNEKGEPDLESMIILLQAMLVRKQDNPAAPIIIHCTDGAGKTGVLLTVFKAILESRDKNVIDIFHIVKKLRSERMNLVPTLTHFVSCFSLMNEYCSNTL